MTGPSKFNRHARMTKPLHDHDLSKLYTDSSSGLVKAPGADVWRVIEGVGGRLGWYAWSVAWAIRGLADSLIGGPGARLTRPDRLHLEPGDIIDWWRVEAVEQRRLLRLRAQTRLPGVAWLELAISPLDDATSLQLTTWFEPHGIAGHLYWLSIKPAHGLVFGGMRRRIASAAEAAAQTGTG